MRLNDALVDEMREVGASVGALFLLFPMIRILVNADKAITRITTNMSMKTVMPKSSDHLAGLGCSSVVLNGVRVVWSVEMAVDFHLDHGGQARRE